MVYVGDPVAQAHDRGLARVVRRAVGVVQNAHARLIAEVQPLTVPLEHVDDAQALLVMLESAGVDQVQRPLAGVAEGRMPQVVPQTDRLAEILVQAQRPRDRARKTRDLQRMGQPRAVVVALGLQKDLGLVFQAPEGLGMGDAVDVALKAGADGALLLGMLPPLRIRGAHAVRPDQDLFQLFAFFSRTGHLSSPPIQKITGRSLFR